MLAVVAVDLRIQAFQVFSFLILLNFRFHNFGHGIQFQDRFSTTQTGHFATDVVIQAAFGYVFRLVEFNAILFKHIHNKPDVKVLAFGFFAWGNGGKLFAVTAE